MDGFTMKQAADAVGGKLHRYESVILTDVAIDHRKVTKDCLFVAIRGKRFNGHDFIEAAYRAGAGAVMAEEAQLGTPTIVVEDTRRALLDLAAFYRSRFHGTVVGITGSVGKTTTKEMIAQVLSAAKKVLKTEGNLNNGIGLPSTLFRLDRSYQAAVIEMGMSARGEISALSQTACPTIGVITNIGVSHMETLGSRENILRAKLEILDGMAEDAPLVLGADDDLLACVRFSERPLIFCRIENKQADFRAEDIKTKGGVTSFTVVDHGASTPVVLPAVGRHNVINALFAFAVGYLEQMERSDIAGALRDYRPADMRQQVIETGEYTVLADCYNASPDSMRAAISVLCELDTAGRRIAVLADMLELGKIAQDEHRKIGLYAGMNRIDALFCYGTLSKALYDGAAGISNRYHFTDKESLVCALRDYIRPGDVILLKGSRSMKLESVMTELFGELL